MSNTRSEQTRSACGVAAGDSRNERCLEPERGGKSRTISPGRILALALAIAVLGSLRAVSAQDAPVPATRTRQVFRLAKPGHPILLPIEIGGGRYPFLLDTGCTNTAFDPALKPLLRGRRSRVRMHTPDGDCDMDLFAAPPLSLGAVPLNGVRDVVCIDFEVLRETYGEVAWGALGMDAIKSMIVQIDFDRNELSLLPSVPDDAGEPFGLSRLSGVPAVHVEVGELTDAHDRIRRPFMIDTGLLCPGSGLLERELFDSLLTKRALYRLADETQHSAAGLTTTRTGRISGLRLGPFQQRGLIVSESGFNSLSLGYLSRYRVIFDFPNDRMYLSPRACAQHADLKSLAGMRLVWLCGDLLIKSVDDGGAADNGCLVAGDVILEIGGVPTKSLNAEKLARILGTPATRSIVVRRGQSTAFTKIELEKPARGGMTTEDRTRPKERDTQSVGEPAPPVKREFHIAKHGNAIVLPVYIGAEEHAFLFDTGTLITCFDESLMHLLRGEAGTSPRQSQFSPGGADTKLFLPPRLSLGGERLRGIAEVTCADLEPLRRALGERFDGVLGMDAISRLAVRIDFDRGELSVLPSPVPKDAGKEIELVGRLWLPSVPVVGGYDEDARYFIIDTGYVALGSGSLDSPRFDSLLEMRKALLIATGSDAELVRPTRTNKAMLQDFAITRWGHRSLIFSKGRFNTLSLNYLSRYLVTFDFNEFKMYLKPGARFAEPDVQDLTGIELSRIGGDTVVEFVGANSSGERAGIRQGDIIVEVDGTRADTFTLLDLRRLFGTPSTRSMKVQRGKEVWSTQLELAEPIIQVIETHGGAGGFVPLGGKTG